MHNNSSVCTIYCADDTTRRKNPHHKGLLYSLTKASIRTGSADPVGEGRGMPQLDLLDDVREGLLFGLGHQVVLPDKEDEVLEGGVQVRYSTGLLELRVVVVVHDGEDAEQPGVNHAHALHEVLRKRGG